MSYLQNKHPISVRRVCLSCSSSTFKFNRSTSMHRHACADVQIRMRTQLIPLGSQQLIPLGNLSDA